ncbi:MAG TPA: phosphatase PAP2 family protein [Vicinamibacterales bacterium]|nr:phosphatase PAP2 family protein [Vicinamibacterales bacterium]
MHPHELLVVGYFVALAMATRRARTDEAHRRRAMRLAILTAGAVVAAAFLTPASVRAWMPIIYLVLGYWIPAILTPSKPDAAFETWLRQTDADWGLAALRVPSWIRQPLELAYLFCYPLVPAAFAVVWTLGRDTDIQRFWFATLLAGYACYATVPWLASRPPRLLAPSSDPGGVVAAFNVRVLRRVSHQLTTFPSGHVAVATAAALTIWPVSRPAGLLLAAIAAGIAGGAVAGRYHFAVDVVLGVVVGAVAVLVSA